MMQKSTYESLFERVPELLPQQGEQLYNFYAWFRGFVS